MVRSYKNNVLVAYFSWSGNTRKIANQINKLVGGDIFEIQAVKEYPASYHDVLERAKQEIRSGAKPELQNRVLTPDIYETLFIGYPNWWSTFPAPVLTFLSEYDFKGKTIIPFCTHGGGGTGRSFNDISRQCPKANVLNGFSINGYAVNENNSELVEWLNAIKTVLNESSGYVL